ncbi:hypothetical protein HN51_038418 [Arachis hypogaea]|uniref:Uncharacterized protein n=3 Tax=Arachis TaxID=3817 RepID=A0A444ZS67_ARAHY|nr:probable methyltransferase At1g27930 [Arachis duranensis]XP_025691680.1 probable methyltransferase At1g27930 [Arachis hypogaea]QHO04144.1 putative methyltransferase [Arachis hypogaea]RYR16998.1 hypothetical protein Ahy_B03g061813 isoform A [Arachis hypogaea]
MQGNERTKTRYYNLLPENRCFVWLLTGLAIIAASLFTATTLLQTSDTTFLCPLTTKTRFASAQQSTAATTTPLQLRAILHYATSHVVPQQSLSEITITFDVFKSLQHRPLNFLVFGLGHDSLMWASLNPTGTTLFLEEDPKWFHTILAAAPDLHAHTVRYRTQLQEADELLQHYRKEEACWPARATLKGNDKCRLALHDLPEEVYEREWDLVMIDAPRGYFAEAPGRMAAIFSAAVMARGRKGSGVTHVFLHDVNRRVEKLYAEEFLCRKNLVKGVGRLWHFQIPAVPNTTAVVPDHVDAHRFC